VSYVDSYATADQCRRCAAGDDVFKIVRQGDKVLSCEVVPQ
jgi:hypothetical protein